jgi:hypothetical protein
MSREVSCSPLQICTAERFLQFGRRRARGTAGPFNSCVNAPCGLQRCSSGQSLAISDDTSTLHHATLVSKRVFVVSPRWRFSVGNRANDVCQVQSALRRTKDDGRIQDQMDILWLTFQNGAEFSRDPLRCLHARFRRCQQSSDFIDR